MTEITKSVLPHLPDVFGIERSLRSRLATLPVYYGWFVVTVCFVCSTITFGTIYSFSVFLDPILSEFGRSYANTSAIFSIQSIVTFGSGAVLGITIDRYGVRSSMAVGGGLAVVGLLVASTSTSFLGVVGAYGIVVAAGLGVVFVISYATPPRWFDRRRGVATAIAASGAGVGILVGPSTVSVLLPHVGWRGAYAVLAGVFFVVIVVSLVVLADGPHDIDSVSASRIGEPDGESGAGLLEQIRLVGRAAQSPSFLLVFLGLVCAFSPAYVMLVHLVEHATDVGFSRSTGVLALSVVGGMNVVGKFLVGPLADGIGTVRTLALCAVSIGTGALLVPLAGVPLALITVVALMGVGYGGMGALISPVIAELFGTLNINALFGLVALSFAITGSVAPYVAALIFDATGSFIPAFIAGGVLGWVAVGVFVVVGRVGG
jgi:OFA family oxalate/formate antiporter-like MFS transporter